MEWDSTILVDRVLLPMNAALAVCRRVTLPRAVHANRRLLLVNPLLVFRPLVMRRPVNLVVLPLAATPAPTILADVR